MLVFTRKTGESLVIAGEVEVKILSVERDQVKVGIAAPRHITVHRQEIHELIKQENLAASSQNLPDLQSLRKLLTGFRKR